MIKKINVSRYQTGFTLIELILVIVILAVLSVVAAPKFINLSSSAKKASRESVAAAIKSAVDLTSFKCVANSSCNPDTAFQSVNINGVSVSLLGQWPQANANGIIKVVDINDFEITFGSNTVIVEVSEDCTVNYHHPLHRRYPTIGGDDTCQ